MAMLFSILLFTCTCALAEDVNVPSYGHIRDTILKAFQILDENVISMDDNIPLMDDPRRHYAQILCVVYAQAEEESACSENDYYRDYQMHLNKTIYIGIYNPNEVIKGTKWLISEVWKEIDSLLKLINSYGLTPSRESDKKIYDEIQKNKKFERPETVFLAVGLAAAEMNKMHTDYFAPRSKNLSVNKFVITGARKLKKFVMAVTGYSKAMYGYPTCQNSISATNVVKL